MDALGMLNALIGLALVYFVLSLIVSAAMEWLTQFWGYRGQIVELATARLMGLEEVPKPKGFLLAWLCKLRQLAPSKSSKAGEKSGDTEGEKKPQTESFDKFFSHPKIQALQQDATRKPSYIPDDTYAAVFLEAVVGLKPAEWRNAPELLREKIKNLPDPVRANLLALLDEASGDPAKFLAGVQAWVNKTWDRATGWLRRRLNPQMFVVALIVAGATNADTVRMFQILTRDTALQDTLVQTAGKLAVEGNGASLQSVLCPSSSNQSSAGGDASAGHKAGTPTAAATQANPPGSGTGNAPTAAGGPAASDAGANPKVSAGTAPDNAQATAATGGPAAECSELAAAKRYALDISPLLGWQEDVKSAWDGGWILGKFVGLLITASALLMGAPFWFDVLQKFVALRQSLKPEAPASKAPAKKAASDAAPATSAAPQPVAATGPTVEALSAFKPQATSLCRENAVWLSRFSDLAYSQAEVARAQGEEWGFKVAGKFDANGSNTQYLLATNQDAAILAFRGTEPGQMADWKTDLKAAAVECHWNKADRVHGGFAKALDDVWNDLIKALKPQVNAKALWITGHSLGGALALLVAHRLVYEAPDIPVRGVITFGQPRCGDDAFVEDVQRHFAGRYWRAVNNRDIVPRVPPYGPDFRHAGTVVYVDDLGRVVIDPQLWYRVLDNLALPEDPDALKAALRERVQDHAISRYSQVLAGAARWTA